MSTMYRPSMNGGSSATVAVPQRPTGIPSPPRTPPQNSFSSPPLPHAVLLPSLPPPLPSSRDDAPTNLYVPITSQYQISSPPPPPSSSSSLAPATREVLLALQGACRDFRQTLRGLHDKVDGLWDEICNLRVREQALAAREGDEKGSGELRCLRAMRQRLEAKIADVFGRVPFSEGECGTMYHCGDAEAFVGNGDDDFNNDDDDMDCDSEYDDDDNDDDDDGGGGIYSESETNDSEDSHRV